MTWPLLVMSLLKVDKTFYKFTHSSAQIIHIWVLYVFSLEKITKTNKFSSFLSQLMFLMSVQLSYQSLVKSKHQLSGFCKIKYSFTKKTKQKKKQKKTVPSDSFRLTSVHRHARQIRVSGYEGLHVTILNCREVL